MKSISGLFVCTLLSGVCPLFLPQQQHHHQAGLYSPQQYYDPDMRMPCSFGRKPKSKVAKPKVPTATVIAAPAPAHSAVGRMGLSGMPRPYIDPDVVADQIDTMRDMAAVGLRNPHSVHGYAAYPSLRPAMPAAPAAAPTAMQAAPVAAPAAAAPAAAARTMFRPQSQPVKKPPVDFFSSLFGFGMVKRHATQVMHHAGNQAYRCMCVPSTDIDGTIYAALRSGRPNPMAEERINAQGKCPMGRTCLCPNLGHGWR